MLALAFFQWWYGEGWRRFLQAVVKAATSITHSFSMPILLQTLFAPWRRIITYGNTSIAMKLRALLDNLISRAVGTVVRSLVLLTGSIGIILVAGAGAVGLLLWPLMPALAIALLVKGLLQ